ncbi:MAG TPA: hypothetical protein VJZ17_02720 [Nitrosopumilaceae archaeon]|nr:hypothetical protein [Nitrosopumilaceae archaeon]
MRSISAQEIYGKAKVGTVAGLVGGFALFASLFGIDSQLGVAPGTFYMMLGLAVGLHDMPAIVFGFMAHMLTAATIGALFCVCSTLHRVLYITSVWKGIFAGGVTGLEVYAIFFIPITLFLMIPTIDSTIIDGSNTVVSAYERGAVTVLRANLDLIMWGALVLHVLYGSIMGLFSGMILHEDYKIPKKKSTDIESESVSST